MRQLSQTSKKRIEKAIRLSNNKNHERNGKKQEIPHKLKLTFVRG